MWRAALERIAQEVRHLQRTEVREVEEPFGGEQRGSSAMPHKRNPVSSEQVCGLARVVRANAMPALEDIALWHERDISHSSVERVILPDSTILTDYMLHRTTEIVANMKVFPERMRRNLDATQGPRFLGAAFAGSCGAWRAARRRLQMGAEPCDGGMGIGDEFSGARRRRREYSQISWMRKALAHTFDLQRQLRAVDAIFRRVFGTKASVAM